MQDFTTEKWMDSVFHHALFQKMATAHIAYCTRLARARSILVPIVHESFFLYVLWSQPISGRSWLANNLAHARLFPYIESVLLACDWLDFYMLRNVRNKILQRISSKTKSWLIYNGLSKNSKWRIHCCRSIFESFTKENSL